MNQELFEYVTNQRNTHHQLWVWGVLLLVMILVSVIRIRLLDVPLERDEGEYAYGGQMLLQGFLPYEPPSLYKYKLPGIYFLYAAALALFGKTQAGVHAGLLVANLTTMLLLFLLAKKLLGSFGAVSTAAFYAVISLSTSVLGLFAHAEHFVMLSTVGGLLLLLKSIDNYRWWKLFLSGVLLGCAYVIRQHGAAFIAFGGTYLIWQILWQSERRWRHLISRPTIFCAGAVLPFLITCGIFLFAGTFDKFWFWTFVYARKNLEFVPFAEGLQLLRMYIYKIITSSPLIWMLALWGSVALLANRRLKSQRFFTTVFFVFSFLSVCPGLYFRRHYFVTLLPAIALLAGLGAAQLKDFALGRLRPSSAALISFAVILISVAWTVCYEYEVFFSLPPRDVSRATYGGNPFPESLEIARYIEKHSSSNDTIAILGSEPQILFYANRRSSTGYTDTYEMMKSHPYAIQMQNEMIREIEAASPRFIVFVQIYSSWLTEPDSYMRIFDWFEKYQEKHYTKVGVVDIADFTTTFYYWGKEAGDYKPVSENWIAVFERKN